MTRATLAAALVLCATLVAPAAAGTPTPIAEVRDEALVTVAGTVERVLDYDEFRLADATGSIVVYVGPRGHDLSVGDAVTITGRVDSWPREIYARSLTRADGSQTTFSHIYE